MSFARWFRSTLALAAAVVLIAGCAKTDGTGGKAGKDTKSGEVAKKKDEPKHEGWWCDEHGIPEADCSMCMTAEKQKKFKDAGDWCKEHNRAQSQCYMCDAALWDKYKAVYKAKEGKDPPLPEKNMPKKKD